VSTPKTSKSFSALTGLALDELFRNIARWADFVLISDTNFPFGLKKDAEGIMRSFSGFFDTAGASWRNYFQ
jgi:hypothetical protein